MSNTITSLLIISLLRADIEEKLNDLSKSGENSVIQSCQRLLNEIDEVVCWNNLCF